VKENNFQMLTDLHILRPSEYKKVGFSNTAYVSLLQQLGHLIHAYCLRVFVTGWCSVNVNILGPRNKMVIFSKTALTVVIKFQQSP
jgi:hypothetical protein